MMLVRVLGSAAGGVSRSGTAAARTAAASARAASGRRPRTQESVAVSADGDDWFLLNASPEVRQQIESFPPLQPRGARAFADRGHPPHERGPRPLPGPALAARVPAPGGLRHRAVRRGFTEGNALFRTLERFPGPGRPGARSSSARGRAARAPAARPSGLLVEPRAGARASCPLHLEGRAPADPEDNVGLRLRDARTGRVAGVLLRASAALTAACARRWRTPTACSSTAPSGRATS